MVQIDRKREEKLTNHSYAICRIWGFEFLHWHYTFSINSYKMYMYILKCYTS